MTSVEESFEIHQTHLAWLPSDPPDITKETLKGIGEGYAVFAMQKEPTGKIHYEEYLIFPSLGCLKHQSQGSDLPSVPLAYDTKMDGVAQGILDDNWNEQSSPDGSKTAPGVQLKKVANNQLVLLWHSHRCDDAVREIAATTKVKKLRDWIQLYIDQYDIVVPSEE